ncbi:OmpA/MotB family protein [Cellulomonas fimi]|uniref:OmpA/MotB domain protein n=1 Tax=Cellulomonas fimi (strain ATCC 484 / DSM 20113 / JCM 1341 / CCUG 24087 / LMG 16345 / NBRC 15513 / NCIMB 8980 / NCTC 7547 / NRS-133) TaxID=590998 RepID=F4GYV6_CELFA|nr:flagellar motor protein MotB [Cellulomonas fimi]AEE44825.1 OmpA/MotB domain protein [Cellulomonas fimi ATCC 484]NNH08360.1 flagellar motor protein MotB [Cellulomonas fimi]VEH27400.1 Chemotaxis protein MotB [Cellulomonas fimi]
MSSHGGRRRSRGGHEEEHVNHERWLVSYSDMITVLMALFIVLFAISQVDQEKYIALRDSLAAGFMDTTTSPSVLDGTDGTLDGKSTQSENTPADGTAGMVSADDGLGQQAAVPPVPATPTTDASVDPATLAAAQAEAAHLTELRDRIAQALAANGLDQAVRMRIDERGLVLGLVADDVFFAPARAELTDTARRVLDVASPLIVGIGENVSVEGHANVIPVSGRYPTNWELSADRATQVLRHLVEVDGMPGPRIMAVGFGDTRPLVAGDSPEALAANRRVDLVILSAAPEQVRALLPSLTGG